MVANIFLGVNEWEIDATEEDVVLLTLGLAAGQIKAGAYA